MFTGYGKGYFPLSSLTTDNYPLALIGGQVMDIKIKAFTAIMAAVCAFSGIGSPLCVSAASEAGEEAVVTTVPLSAEEAFRALSESAAQKNGEQTAVQEQAPEEDETPDEEEPAVTAVTTVTEASVRSRNGNRSREI